MKKCLLIVLIFIVGIQYSAFGQEFKKLKFELSKKFPNDSTIIIENTWVFNNETANIMELEKPVSRKYLNGFNLYKVNLTNFLGHHIESVDCLIIYKSQTSKLELIAPILFDDSMERFASKFQNEEFKSKAELKMFISQIQKLMLIGSLNMNFENTKFYNNKVTFDLIQTKNSKKKVWRKMKFEICKNKIIKFIGNVGNDTD